MGKGKPAPTHHVNAPRWSCTCTNRAPDESVSPKPNTRPYSGPAKVLDENPSRSYYDRRLLGSSLRSLRTILVQETGRDEENLRLLETNTPSDNMTIVLRRNHPHDYSLWQLAT